MKAPTRERDRFYRNRDLVHIEVSDHQISLLWDIDAVSPGPLSSAMGLLAAGRQGDRTIVLKFLKLGWAEERYFGSASALRRIEQLQTYRDVPVLPVTRIQRLPLSDISFGAKLLRLAHAAATRDGSDWFDQLLGGPLARHGLFFVRAAPLASLTFAHIGSGSACARMLGRTWQSQAVGTASNSAFADQSFDSRISSSYELSTNSGEGILEHIVGLVDLGSRHVWIPYQRLLLPDGERLACFTKITRHLACPLFTSR